MTKMCKTTVAALMLMVTFAVCQPPSQAFFGWMIKSALLGYGLRSLGLGYGWPGGYYGPGAWFSPYRYGYAYGYYARPHIRIIPRYYGYSPYTYYGY